jgi:capsular polysaccharide biosynthesis protein
MYGIIILTGDIIHCDGFAGLNLCHFVYDTINPILFLLERGMITRMSPLLISEKIYTRPYFKFVLNNTHLGELNWVVQKGNEWIKIKSFRKAFVSMEIFKSTYKFFQGVKNPHRKIFLNRKAYFQRNIKNINLLFDILNHYGFEFVFAEDLTYEEQVKLFRDVKYFVGIHGAGLTNLLHSDIPAICVLEIFSESYVHASFYRFLKILGVKYYDAIAGSKFDLNWNFTIDEKAFERRVQKLIAQ